MTRGSRGSGIRVGSRRCQSPAPYSRSEEHTSELQSQSNLVCRLLLEKKKKQIEYYLEHDATTTNKGKSKITVAQQHIVCEEIDSDLLISSDAQDYDTHYGHSAVTEPR